MLPGEFEHLVGHVETDRFTRRSDPPGTDQDIGPAAGAQVEHRLPFTQIRDFGRDPAAER